MGDQNPYEHIFGVYHFQQMSCSCSLDKILTSIVLAQDIIPITISDLSGRMLEMTKTTTRGNNATPTEGNDMDASEPIASLENTMLEMNQHMSKIGAIGELNIAKGLLAVMFKILNAIKTPYSTVYVLAIHYGQEGPGDGPHRASLNADAQIYVRDHLLEGINAKILKTGHAVADAFYFAEGLSVPDIITATAAVHFGNVIEDVVIDDWYVAQITSS